MGLSVVKNLMCKHLSFVLFFCNFFSKLEKKKRKKVTQMNFKSKYHHPVVNITFPYNFLFSLFYNSFFCLLFFSLSQKKKSFSCGMLANNNNIYETPAKLMTSQKMRSKSQK